MRIARPRKADTDSEKLLGRYNELVLLLLGFFLSTIVGGMLAYWYQSLAWSRDDEARRKSEELARASALFEDISRMMDKRLYRLRNVQDALEQRLSVGELEKCREEYRASVAEWNETLNRNLWATERYFGKSLRNTLEATIQEGFRSLHRDLSETLKDPSGEKVNRLKASIDDFNPLVYAFDGEMLDTLERGAVGTFREPGERDR
jgi:DNA anti-recombination protein RmuC